MKNQLIVLSLSALLFITSSCDKDNELRTGPQYVDLGLSVNWATFNIGASQPQEYGDYFAWAETETKYYYYWSTYKYNIGEYDEENLNSLTKYCPKSKFGYNEYTDTLIVIELSDDIANVKWGGNWRIPTVEEFQELLDNCTWKWTKLNGVKGFKVTSNIEGHTDKSIFIPAAGYKSGPKLFNSCPTVNYWTSSLWTRQPHNSLDITFHYDEELKTYEDIYNEIYIGYSGRYVGRPIRPVCAH